MIHQIDLSSDEENVYPKTCSGALNSYDDNDSIPSPPPAEKKRKEKGETKAALLKKERELKALERKRKQALKPGNCMKLIKVIVSADLLQNAFAGDLIVGLNKAEIAYRVNINPGVSSSICWEKQDPLDEESVVEEDHMVVLMRAEELVNLISSYQLNDKIKEMQFSAQGKRFTLVIYELENYFRFEKTKKNREFRNEVRGQNSKNQEKRGVFSDAAVVSREQVECSLAELQVLYNCGHCVFNEPASLSSYVCQYTKAVAEAPFKLERKNKGQQELEWFAQGDSRAVVRVDKQCNGLARLWRQQLCQFNLAGLETSEAIAYAYPSPKALTEAYDELSHEDGQLLLQNLQLRRGAGPLSSERRIGPQLSRKMHTFFTGTDGNTDISKD